MTKQYFFNRKLRAEFVKDKLCDFHNKRKFGNRTT